ncbi:MAG: acyl-phosphate glycerol 3-phosphate acyltransferase [Anaerosolibacter sp.]|jgi:1-acyl-sn-glycerol-3-phosphate acyltransferase|uniref:lysophospholipid acyltransferase family protein n=1 Tax=Anaerosolibacter sp. TaxID=1872527 RepID=UPI0026164ACE|nr:lysophospholipid acyltransferase family protein [Anaerosolibacter sp.]MDF2547902.1 acyl-phosphate glycerol 3-phosphate acyltransferase [Anaerosolibacter sp.]
MNFYWFARNLMKFFIYILFRVDIDGLEKLPREGAYIVCSNHINYLDPLVIGTSIHRKMSYMAKEELFKNKLFGYILLKLGMFPVNRSGADISAIKSAIRVLNKGDVLGIFPEGTRNLQKSEMKAKPGLAMIAIKAKVPIVPVAIISDYKLFGKIKIKINEPIIYDEYYHSKIDVDTYQQLSQKVMDTIEYQTKLSALIN